MNCPHCGKENAEEAAFCNRCGKELRQFEAVPEGDQPCYRHAKTLTALRCGKCERPICTKCTVLGPAGQRCPDCAKLNVKVSGRGVLYNLTQPFKGLMRSGPYTIYFTILLISMVFGLIRSCARSVPREVITKIDSGRGDE